MCSTHVSGQVIFTQLVPSVFDGSDSRRQSRKSALTQLRMPPSHRKKNILEAGVETPVFFVKQWLLKDMNTVSNYSKKIILGFKVKFSLTRG